MKKFEEAKEEFIKQYVTEAYKASGKSVAKMSKLTGIDRAYCYRLLKRYGVEHAKS